MQKKKYFNFIAYKKIIVYVYGVIPKYLMLREFRLPVVILKKRTKVNELNKLSI